MNTYNTLINGFCKEGNLEKARELLQEISEKGCRPNLLTYNTLIDGLCKHHKLDEAQKIFYDMPKQGLRPMMLHTTH
jgi:pentatricopeptide repeat protein